MNSLNKIVKNNILFNKSRSIVTCISIIISISLMMGIDILITSTKIAMKNDIGSKMDETPLILFVLSLIVGIVVIIFIYSTFKIYVMENTKLYGILRAIGIKKSKLFCSVVLQGIFYGIISIPIGLCLGFFVCKGFVALADTFLMFYSVDVPIVLTTHSVIMSIFYGLVSILISVFYPAILASSVSPIKAINNITSIESTHNDGYILRFASKFSNYKFRLVLTDIISNKSKSAFIIIVFSISLVLVTVFSAVFSYTNEFGSNSRVYAFDFEIINKSGFTEEYISYLSSNELIKSVSIVDDYMAIYKVEEEKVNMNHPYALYTPYKDGIGDIQTSLLSYDNELLNKCKKYIVEGDINVESLNDGCIVYVNESMVDVINNNVCTEKLVNLNVGDKISLDLSPSKHGMYETEVKAIVNSLPYSPSLHIEGSVYFIVSNETFDGIFNKSGTNNLKIKLKDKSYEKEMEKLLQNEINEGRLSEYDNLIDYRRSIRQEDEFIKYIFLFFTLMLFLVGVIITVNMMVGNIIAKSKQFLIYKSIGIKQRDINKIISMELIFYMISSLLVGLIIGIPSSIIAYNVYVKGDFIKVYKFPYFDVGLYIIAMIISTLIAYYISTKQVKNVMRTHNKF
ncbi:FtsX-like permease family protein [Clostridium sp.]|uniref:ABC transporter permease n=1 Tax=Clostridium sp. TaxID=1506 RepID=UPI003217A1FF